MRNRMSYKDVGLVITFLSGMGGRADRASQIAPAYGHDTNLVPQARRSREKQLDRWWSLGFDSS